MKKLLSLEFALLLIVAPLLLNIFVILTFGMIGGFSLEQLRVYLLCVNSVSFIGFAVVIYNIIRFIFKN